MAVYDQPANGGNGDGLITEADAVYAQLRLWIDTNHDGISQPDELQTLEQAGVRAISLHAVSGKYVDAFGNVYRYRSHVVMDRDLQTSARQTRRAVDVFFTYRAQ